MKKNIFSNILFLAVFIFLCFTGTYVYSQNQSEIDSLESVFEKAETDSLKNEALNLIFDIYIKDNWGQATNTAKNGIASFEESNPDYTVFWYCKLGDIYLEQGFYTMSLSAFQNAFEILNETEKNAGYVLLDIAKLYYLQENYYKAIDIYKDVLTEYENLNSIDPVKSSLGIAKAYNKLGIVYELQGEIKESKEYFKKALEIRLETDSKKDIVDSYTTLGFASYVIQEYDTAIYFFTKGLSICNTYKNYHYFNDLHLFRSISYAKKGMYREAYNDIDTAERYALSDYKFDLARVYYFYALTDFEKDDYSKFKSNAELSIQYADSFNLISIKSKTLKLLINASKKYSDYKNAFLHQNSLTELVILKESEKLLQLERNIEFESEKRRSLELEKTNEGLKQDNELFQILILAGILIFLLLIFILIVIRRKNKKVSSALKLAETEKIKAEEATRKLDDSMDQIRSQAALAKILRNVTGKERSIKKFLQDALDELLSLSWLNILTKGAIFLTDINGNLEMVAEKDLGGVALSCAVIEPGECLCGKALSEKKMQYSSHIDHNHEITFENIKEHGHYILPIMMHYDVLGVLNIYIEHKHKISDFELKFLHTVSDTLASVINRKYIQDDIIKAKEELNLQMKDLEEKNKAIQKYSVQIEQQSQEQENLNQQLFAEKLEVEQRNVEIERLKEEAESAYKNIKDSINYAKTIQDALMSSEEEFHKYFADDYLIYYEPKETIGGDFYFVNKVNDTIIFAAADCTGHGVPGALITMLGITFLQDITDRNLLNTTGEGLQLLREKIKNTFQSYGSNIQNTNGMDIAFCAINTKTKIMQYSGAFRPLVIIRDNEIIEYKATKNPIGFYPVEKEFETHEIQLEKNDLIYLFSDGYVDQIGGEQNKKFLRRQFYELLKKIHKYPMQKQKFFFEKIIKKWKGDNYQVDDIVILGIKWSN